MSCSSSTELARDALAVEILSMKIYSWKSSFDSAFPGAVKHQQIEFAQLSWRWIC